MIQFYYPNKVKSLSATNYWSNDLADGVDSVGGLNLTASNATTGNPLITSGKSLTCNGTSTRLYSATPVSMALDMSWSAWFYATSIAQDYLLINLNADASDGTLLQISSTGGLIADWRIDGTTYTCRNLTAGTLAATTRYHVVACIAADNTRTLYLNGVPKSFTTDGGWVPTVGGAAFAAGIWIGAASWVGGSNWFTGRIDEVSFHNRVLTATEVAALYKLGTSYILRNHVSHLPGLIRRPRTGGYR